MKKKSRNAGYEDFDFIGEDAVLDLNQYASKPKKPQRDWLRLAVNIVAPIAIVCSLFFILFAPTLLGTKVFGDDFVEKEGMFVPIQGTEGEEVKYFVISGVHEDENLTDVILVACFDIRACKMTLLQIPRDLWVGDEEDIWYPNPANKANAIYSNQQEGEYSPLALNRKINSHFGLPVDHYVVLTIPAFRDIVDAVGGVWVDVEETLYCTPYLTIPRGHQHFNGEIAEYFVRLRNYPQGDLDRVNVQRQFYIGFAKQMMDMSFWDIQSAFDKVHEDVKSDMTYNDFLKYIQKAKELNPEDIEIYTVPGEPFEDGEISFYSIHKQEYVDLINAKFLPWSDKITVDDIKIIERSNEYENAARDGKSFKDK